MLPTVSVADGAEKLVIFPAAIAKNAVRQSLADGVDNARGGSEIHIHSPIDHEAIVYGPSVIYMVAEMIRQWSNPGDGIVASFFQRL
jgi:hypothetical protein